MQTKSPFFVVEEFLSPLMCENILEDTDFNFPDVDERNRPVKTVRFNRIAESRIFPRIEDMIPTLESYYGFEYAGTLPFDFEWFPEGSKEPFQRCENSKMIGNKWVRINDYCLTGIVFLKDFVDGKLIDVDFEVYGGKLEFPVHQFGFNPRRGTLIFFPSEQHFVNATSTLQVGDLMQIRIQIASKELYKYDIKKFPGNYTNWF